MSTTGSTFKAPPGISRTALQLSSSGCFPKKPRRFQARLKCRRRGKPVYSEAPREARPVPLDASPSGKQLQEASFVDKLRDTLQRSTDLLPYAVVAAALLSLVRPSSFAWFTTKMYGPALGFLMFAVGVNLDASAFSEVFKTPQHILVGILAQWLVKPLLGVLVAATVVPFMAVPPQVGTGIVLMACVSGAQLSNYATYLVHPEHAPLSIVLTALSTLCGAVFTPALILFLLGKRVPVNAPQMALSIAQVVVAPVAAGILCNRYLSDWVQLVRPYVVFASLLDTCACIGASLSSNAVAARSILGLQLLIPVCLFHFAAFAVGHRLARETIAKDSTGLARCISLETGMQSSLLALLLASKFLNDPLISLPCGLSVIVMTLSGFFLVLYWKEKDLDKRTAALIAKS